MVEVSSVLDKFVFVFRQSTAVKKYSGLKTTGVEIWAKNWDILLPCKKGGQQGSNVCGYFMSSAGGLTVGIVSTGA